MSFLIVAEVQLGQEARKSGHGWHVHNPSATQCKVDEFFRDQVTQDGNSQSVKKEDCLPLKKSSLKRLVEDLTLLDDMSVPPLFAQWEKNRLCVLGRRYAGTA